MRKSRALRDAQDKESAQTVAGVLSAATVTITARAGAEGRLFGSVTTTDIAEAVAAQTGAVLDRRKIRLAEPLKSVGTHVVPVAAARRGRRRADRRGRRRAPDQGGAARPGACHTRSRPWAGCDVTCRRPGLSVIPRPSTLGTPVVHMVVHRERRLST